MANTTKQNERAAAPQSADASAASSHQGDDETRSPGRALEDAKEVGTELLGTARESVVNIIDDQRKRAADQIVAMGEALRRSAEPFDRDIGLPIGQYADEAARRIGGFAETIRTRSWSQLAGDVEDFARDWPIAFMAAAVGIGFVGGRLLLSAAPRREEQNKTPNPAPNPTPSAMIEPTGGARHDYGAVSGPVSGNARAGYGAAQESRTQESR